MGKLTLSIDDDVIQGATLFLGLSGPNTFKVDQLKRVLEHHFEKGELGLHVLDEEGEEACPQPDDCPCPEAKAFNDAMREDE